MHAYLPDLATVGLLVLVEALLSADNALVLAVMVLGLERAQQRKALRHGLAGAAVFRVGATLLAIYLVRIGWIKLAGALYLLFLSLRHFLRGGGVEARRQAPPARGAMGLSPLWATIVKVEVVNVAFSIDSILVAVAMSPKLWVVLTGGLLGLAAMRFVVAQVLALVRRYPALVDGAFIIVAWVGIEMLSQYAHGRGWTEFEVNRWVSFGVIVGIFLASYGYARSRRP